MGMDSNCNSKNHHMKEQRAPPSVSGIVEPVIFATHVFAIEMYLMDLVSRPKSDMHESQ